MIVFIWTNSRATLRQICMSTFVNIDHTRPIQLLWLVAINLVMSMMLLLSFTLAVLQLHVKTNQAYLITAGFLHKHSYERKNFAVVSVNRHQLQPPDHSCGPHFPSRNISGTICEISFALLTNRYALWQCKNYDNDVQRLQFVQPWLTCRHTSGQ